MFATHTRIVGPLRACQADHHRLGRLPEGRVRALTDMMKTPVLGRGRTAPGDYVGPENGKVIACAMPTPTSARMLIAGLIAFPNLGHAMDRSVSRSPSYGFTTTRIVHLAPCKRDTITLLLLSPNVAQHLGA